MNKCMETDKPLISILMAVYEPRLDWLRDQLLSLNAQTYPNLRLYIRDDCSNAALYQKIQLCVQDCISAFPYTIVRNRINLGSNGTFERLTTEAEGEYFAYCDQDDVWLPEKLTVLQQAIEHNRALLACSDMYIIDCSGKRIADSITKVRRHHRFKSGENLAKGLLTHNFVTGCTMLVRSVQAKAAVPFCPYMVHDHYIALHCAAYGALYSVSEQLISYRIHGGNQTNILGGVRDKSSYGIIRINTCVSAFEWLQEHFPCVGDLQQSISQYLVWLRVRELNWKQVGFASSLWEKRSYGPRVSVFEIVAARAPEKLFLLAIYAAKKNWI